MCIAIASPINNPVPSKKFLKRSWDNNPDGAGFCFNNNGKVEIHKGFMTWEDFWATFQKYSHIHDFTKCGVLIHFRISTHGGVNEKCCHPFPLSSKEKLLQSKRIIANYGIIHNGIISLTSSQTYKRNCMSDTMIFIEKYLTKIASNAGWFDNITNFELIGDIIGSKMAVMDGEGYIRMTAGFEKDKDGNYYSNDTYKKDRVKYINSIEPYGRYDKYVSLMKLKKGQYAVTPENTGRYTSKEAEYYSCDYYMDKNGTLYGGHVSYNCSEDNYLWVEGKNAKIFDEKTNERIDFTIDKVCEKELIEEAEHWYMQTFKGSENSMKH